MGCKISDCSRKLFSARSGMCQRHHKNQQLHGTPNPSCTIDGCSRAVIARSLCQPHYDRKRRYGDFDTRVRQIDCILCQTRFEQATRGPLSNYCPGCRKLNHNERMRRDRWRKGLWEKYRILPSDYFLLLDAQGGMCAICGTDCPGGRGKESGRFSVDHCHRSGKVRGLLCTHCNTGIGLLKDDVGTLRAAMNYLEKHSG